MNPSEQIRELELEREQQIARGDAVRDVARTAGRDITEDEGNAITAALDRVEAIDRQLEILRRQERLSQRRAEEPAPSDDQVEEPTIEQPDDELSRGLPGLPSPNLGNRPSSIRVGEMQKPPGSLFAEMAIARAIFGEDSYGAMRWARSRRDPLLEFAVSAPADLIARAASAPGDTTTDGWAEQISGLRRMGSEFVELLYNASVIRSLRGRMREISFAQTRTVQIPRQTSGVSGGFIGEDNALIVEEQAFDQITLTPKKIGTIVLITRELAVYSNPAAVQIVTDDMVEGLAGTMDTRFCTNSAATATAFAGVFNGGGTVTASVAASDIVKISEDMVGLMNDLDGANIPSDGRVVLMHTAQRNGAWGATDSLGAFPYRGAVESGRIAMSDLVASNAMASGDVGMFQPRSVLAGFGAFPYIDTSTDATVHADDSNPDEDLGGATPPTPVISLWQRDLVGVRCIYEADFVKRRAAAASLASSVGW